MKKQLAIMLILMLGFNSFALASEYSQYSGTNTTTGYHTKKKQKIMHKINPSDAWLKKYLENFKPYLSYNYDKTDVLYNIAKTNPGKELLRIPLQDGDYAVLYETPLQYTDIDCRNYVVEYHANGSIMGIAVIADIDYNVSRYETIIFYEYRLTDNNTLEKKHTMFVDMEHYGNNTEYAQLIFDKNGNIICYEINGKDVYIANNSRNLTVDLGDDFIFDENEQTTQDIVSQSSGEIASNSTGNQVTNQSENWVFPNNTNYEPVQPSTSHEPYTKKEQAAMMVGVGTMVALSPLYLASLAIGVPAMVAASPILLPVAIFCSKRNNSD